MRNKMKLDFKAPTVPDFVKTEQGEINLKFLSEDELEEFADLWFDKLKRNRIRLMKQKEIK